MFINLLKQLNAVLAPHQQSILSNYLSASLLLDMSDPWCYVGPSFCYAPAFNVLTMKNINKNQSWYVPFMLSDIILAQWQHPVASSESLDLLHQVMRTVLY
jgi:hypothetical protein